MSPTDLDARARTAAHDARASVEPVVHAALSSRRPTMRTHRARTLPLPRVAALAAVALAIGTVLVAGGGGGQDSKVLTDGAGSDTATPASPSPSDTPPPPHSSPDLGEAVLAEGAATDGRSWVLHMGGPDNQLCFSVDLSMDASADGRTTSVCGSTPLHPDERHRPRVSGDVRTPPFVFGRMPEDVVAVEVLLEDGTRSGRHAVHRSEEGPVYAVELPTGTAVVAVVGIRDDGTSVRFDVAG